MVGQCLSLACLYDVEDGEPFLPHCGIDYAQLGRRVGSMAVAHEHLRVGDPFAHTVDRLGLVGSAVSSAQRKAGDASSEVDAERVGEVHRNMRLEAVGVLRKGASRAQVLISWPSGVGMEAGSEAGAQRIP